MPNTAFFIAWPLWAEMTFVLACGIVVVFFAGLVKLWWQTRYVRKHTLLDEERRSRQQDMRKSGIPTSKRVDIPFGVRAIQNGLEVDGIWISTSTPNTPAGTDSGAPSIMTAESEYKGKEKMETSAIGVKAAASQLQSPQASPSSSYFDAKEVSSVTATHLNATRGTYQPKQLDARFHNPTTSQRAPSPQGYDIYQGPATRPVYLDTYVPTNPPDEDLQARHYRNSGSSSDRISCTEIQRSLPVIHPRSMEAHGRRGASEDAELSWRGNDESFSGPVTEQCLARLEGPFETHIPEIHRLGSHITARRDPGHSRQRSNELPLHTRNIAQSHRRMPPANDTHANTTTRRVNPGFEVLPAGTFVVPENRIDSDTDQSPRRSRADSRVSLVGKFQRKGHGRSFSGET